VGAGGLALLSSDGTSWATENTGTTNDLYAATFGATYYVAVGAGGTIVYSTDGVSWTPSPVLTTATLRGVSYGLVPSADGLTVTNAFIAVGDGGVLLTSPNGIEWSVQPPIASVTLNAAVNGGRFVVVGAGGHHPHQPERPRLADARLEHHERPLLGRPDTLRLYGGRRRGDQHLHVLAFGHTALPPSPGKSSTRAFITSLRRDYLVVAVAGNHLSDEKGGDEGQWLRIGHRGPLEDFPKGWRELPVSVSNVPTI
jgi:hypothetical protein